MTIDASDSIDASEPSASEPLGRLVRKGVTWSLLGLIVGRVGTLLSGIVLARLLDPKDYGVFAVALVALVLIANLNDLGLEQTLVRWPGDITAVAPTAKTVILLSSLAQFALLFLLAPFFASALNSPEATGVVRLLSIGVVVNGLFAVPSAVLTRRFRQDLRTAADFIGFVITMALTVGLALAGFGVWSLAWGRIAGNAVNGGLHAVFARSPYGFGYDRVLARQLLAQGLPIAGMSLLAVAVLNVDNLVVGRVLGPVALGFYTLAFNLSSWPVSVFAVAVWRVSVPAFARMQDDLPRLRDAFARAFAVLMAATLPVCVLLSALALPLIRVVYGDKWSDAAPALTVLAGLGALRVAIQLMTDVLVAVGRGRRAFVLQAIWLAALVPALAIGAHIGQLPGAALAHVLVGLVLMVPLHLHALAPLGIRARMLASAAARPVIGAVAAGIVAYVVATAMTQADVMRLAAAGFSGLLVFAAAVSPMRHTVLAFMRR